MNWFAKRRERKNKLTAICDELFPEMTQIFKNPNLPTALVFRERFPTPAALAAVPLSDLHAARGKSHYYSDVKLQELQRLASQTIGTKDLIRQRGLLLEQTQLIRELRVLQEHIEQLESEMRTIVEQAREGQILGSMFIGPIQAATIIAAIGSIENFPNAGSLKSYFGWAPTREQTGTSYDRSRLTQGGTRTMRQMMFLIVGSVIKPRNRMGTSLQTLGPEQMLL
jgi:transposase